MSVKNINNLPVLNAITGEEKVILSAGGQAKSVPAKLIGQQADWAETDTESPAFVKNKPEIPEQLQADWSQTDTEAKDFIKNKPTGLATQEYVNNAVSNIPVSTPVQPDWNQTDETAPDYVKNKPGGYTAATAHYSGTINVESGGYATIDYYCDDSFYYDDPKFIVNFDGTEQEYEVRGEYLGGGTYDTFVGNGSLCSMGDDTGEPFCWYGYKIYTVTPGEHTIAIKTEQVTPFESKYLVQPDWRQTDASAADFINNKPLIFGDFYVDYDNPSKLYKNVNCTEEMGYYELFSFMSSLRLSKGTLRLLCDRAGFSIIPTATYNTTDGSSNTMHIEFYYGGEYKEITISSG